MRVEITRKDGTKLPFIVTLVQENGAWRVHSLALAAKRYPLRESFHASSAKARLSPMRKASG